MLSLQEYIKETLKQIVMGVKEAQDELVNEDALINPQVFQCDGLKDRAQVLIGSSEEQKRWLIQDIEFDVAVTVSKNDKDSAGVGINVPVISLGKKDSSSSQNSSIQRMKFSIPVMLPAKEFPESKSPHPQKPSQAEMPSRRVGHSC